MNKYNLEKAKEYSAKYIWKHEDKTKKKRQPFPTLGKLTKIFFCFVL